MATMVLYFSRTGNSKRVAEKIAKELQTQAYPIEDHQNWGGFIGYIRGGYYASRNKPVSITITADYKQADHLVVVSPLWAGGPAPAVRSLIKEIPPAKMTLVLTCAGSDVEGAIDKYESQVGKFKGRFGIAVNQRHEAEKIKDIVSSLI